MEHVPGCLVTGLAVAGKPDEPAGDDLFGGSQTSVANCICEFQSSIMHESPPQSALAFGVHLE